MKLKIAFQNGEFQVKGGISVHQNLLGIAGSKGHQLVILVLIKSP